MIYLMVWMTGYVCYENDLPYIDYYFTMIIAFQLAVFALIATSSILLISVSHYLSDLSSAFIRSKKATTSIQMKILR